MNEYLLALGFHVKSGVLQKIEYLFYIVCVLSEKEFDVFEIREDQFGEKLEGAELKRC